jgi:methyl-accepting chemotaxis protein
MKGLKDLSLKKKLPLVVGILSFIILAGIGITIHFLFVRAASSDAKEMIQLNATATGETLAAYINGAAGAARSISGVIAQIPNSDLIADENKRMVVYREIEAAVQADTDNKKLPNIWCTFEPDALDGLDSLFANSLGSDENGRFTPWTGFTENGFVTQTLEDTYNRPAYMLAKTAKKEILTEPILYDTGNGKQQCFFSIAIPLTDSGKFTGAIGVDFNAEEMVRMFRKDNSIRSGRLVTNRGIIAFDFETKLIGSVIADGNKEILSKLTKGKTFDGRISHEGEKAYTVYVPIRIGLTGEPWFYMESIFESEMYASAHRIAFLLLFLMLLAITLISYVSGKLMRITTNRIGATTEVVHTLSLGNLDVKRETAGYYDEIEQMNEEIGILIDGIRRTSDFAKNIGQGNFNADFQLLSDKDVLGNSLLEMRENLLAADRERKQHQMEEELRNWARTGIARFAEILRQDNNSMEILSYNIIHHLVKYMEVNQGGIFLLNDEDGEHFIEMKACYAYDRKKYAKKHIRIGEGLVGMCYLEGEPIYMTEVPDEYVTITSGLGDANPRAIFITPLKINSEIFGVIELASFTPLEPYKIEFMEKVCESIAATISSVKVNIRTNKLLEQTKIQAEEMANAKEELRQNMEEMQATQEEAQRRENELKKMLAQMEAAQRESEEREHETQHLYQSICKLFGKLEFTPDGILETVNADMLTVLGAAESDYAGYTFAETYPGGEEEGNNVWNRLNCGEQVSSSAEVNGYTIRVEYIPVLSEKGILKKVVAFLIHNGVKSQD